MPNSWILPALICLAVLPFLPFLGLPLISDDYSQLFFARRYVSLSGLGDLAGDVLYRSRATSLLLTRGVDALFGLSQPAHLAAGLLLHALNVALLFQLARSLRLDRATAMLAAACFATHSGHQEAIVWIASHHELLVFSLGAVAVFSWLRWLHGGGNGWGLASSVAYLAALYSKESAVVLLPLLAALWWTAPHRTRAKLAWLFPLLAVTLLYTTAIFQASASHLHLNDGTFSFGAPFWVTLPVSLARLLWPAGFIGLAIVFSLGDAAARRLSVGALLWMILALLPYVFLTYQNRVPSRHTYLAAAGLALLLAAALRTLANRLPRSAAWAVPALFALLFAGNLANLWSRKLPQFERRAQATERFLDFASRHPGPIAVGTAPFPLTVYQHAAAIVFGRTPESVQRFRAPLDSQTALYSDVVHP